MQKFTIDTNYLAACLKIAPKDIGASAYRPYLVGVHVDFEARALIATDGHCLIAISDALDGACDGVTEKGEQMYAPIPKRAPITVDYDACAELVKDAKGARVSTIECEIIDGNNLTWITWTVAGMNRKTIVKNDSDSGRYPDWRRIVPRSVTLEPAQFDPQLLAKMHDAFAAALNLKKGKFVPLTLSTNGARGAAVADCGRCNILGIIMPWKDGGASKTPEALRVAHRDLEIVEQKAASAATTA